MAHYNKKFITCLMTTACNLRCKYCITSSMERKNIHIDTDFVRAAMQEYFEKTRNFKVRFYSVGEPTQNIEGIKKVREIACDLAGGEGVYFELLTNGCFDDEVAEWIGNHIHRVWVSYDGPRDVCDQIRVTPEDTPSTGRILKTVERLKDMTSVGIGLTVSLFNLRRQKEIIDEIHELGIDCVISKAVLNPVGKTVDDIYAVDIIDYAREFVEAWRHARELGVHYTNDLVFNFDGHSSFYCRACEPTPHLTPDGFVSSCDRAFSGDTPIQDLIYGKWDAQRKEIDYFPERMDNLRSRRVENMEECSDCEIRYQCCGHCLGTTFQWTGDIFQPIREYCPAIKFLYGEMKKDMRPGEFWPVEYTN
ncbi:MAG: radical SAM protein [Thermoleophilia bacterium]|nr:radical SAM protein [Thermoleophilia bacterium]